MLLPGRMPFWQSSVADNAAMTRLRYATVALDNAEGRTTWKMLALQTGARGYRNFPGEAPCDVWPQYGGDAVVKIVKAVVETGSNYVFHLMAVARNGFDSEYAARYRGSVNVADILALEQNRRDLSFRDGGTGNLTYLMLFFPCYLNLETTTALEEYVALLNKGLAKGDCAEFMLRYQDAFDRQREWTHSVDGEWVMQRHLRYRDVIVRLGEAYIRNLQSYLSQVWPIESEGMYRVADELNDYLDQADLIGRWEALVGIEFRIHPYEIVLCSAIKNGPSANSLGYERNVFYSGDDMDYMRKFISHEVGTHILFPMLKNLSEGRDPSLSYKAFESLARFYNSLVLQTSDLYPMGPFYDADTFFRIYESIYRSRPTISPAELAIEGLSRYSQR